MKKHQLAKGFTLIEMIVALGLFAVVTTITTGAILMLVATNQRFHYEQSIMTNLAFALDSMTREIRTGSQYHCASGQTDLGGIFGTIEHENITSTRDCTGGRGENPVHGISFIESGDSLTGVTNERILYFYNANEKMIYRRIGNLDPEPIVSEGVEITAADFFVHDTTPLLGGNDPDQPSVTIYLTAKAADDNNQPPRSFTVQTTINQRSLDL